MHSLRETAEGLWHNDRFLHFAKAPFGVPGDSFPQGGFFWLIWILIPD